LLCIHCGRVFFIVVFCVCVLFECVVTLCNVCYLSVMSYCFTTATGLHPIAVK
jgi:hypothetical protein